MTDKAMDYPVVACTPDLFPDLMATALTRQDIAQSAGANGIELIRCNPVQATFSICPQSQFFPPLGGPLIPSQRN